MNPRHLKQVPKQPEDRRAIAPYNFVELPEKVVEAELESNGKLRNNDRYYPDRHTGKIICTLKTESPLYIRCGLTPADFAAFSDKPNEELTTEQRKKKAEFFQHPANLHPVLPGSSLRGMLRTLVEIVSFSKIEIVSDQKKFFFRAVAADSDDPLKGKYTELIGNLAKNVKAGYLEKRADKWVIRPAQGDTFLRVKEEDIKADVPSLITMEKGNYLPQYIEISFEENNNCLNISEDREAYPLKGILVTSGNMLDTGRTTEAERRKLLARKEGRKYHYIVLQADSSATPIEISEDAIRDYRDSLTDFQKSKPFEDHPKNPFDENMGFLKVGRPIFYCGSPTDKPIVTLFGQSPNFRIPYTPKNDGKAATAVDFIPKDVGESDKIDLADAIFGFVRRRKKKKEQVSVTNDKKEREQSRAGRVFISDAHYKTDENGIWLTDDTITPQILASPKPTTFQHYLVQPEHTKAVKSELKHYGKSITETVIRGHKLYWHKGAVSKKQIETDATETEIQEKQSQYTEIKPIKAGVSLEFTIHFENLSDVELGALLWVLSLSGENTEKLKLVNLDGSVKYRLSLGMGKPLGMGAVMISKYELFLNERYRNQPHQRYTKLLDGSNWLTGDRLTTLDEHTQCIQKFEEYVIKHISNADLPQDYPDEENPRQLNLKDIPRIKMLLTMLIWNNFPPVKTTRYMEIERDVNKDYICQPTKEDDETVNEYKCRPVLPTPFQVMEQQNEDNRRLNDSTAPSKPSPQTHTEGGSNSAAFARGKKPPKRK
ncbi:TIGR03986 family CRISPR-associated RAMP protein [Tolypothrix campylonemoides VB511288]|nr:TIGR03986 family CRISPR-associated RAMP protein [Tolypothrix campylonemoides VB511288]